MVALGIEKLKDNPDKAQKVIEQAVAVACEWDVYSKPPIITRVQYGRKLK
jgi:hypothetical protein